MNNTSSGGRVSAAWRAYAVVRVETVVHNLRVRQFLDGLKADTKQGIPQKT